MSNSLANASAPWIGDGSDGSTLTVNNGNEIIIGSANVGTPFNARLDSDKAASDYCFNVQIQELDGSFSVGVVREDGFRAGWKTKGMFYNGNLTNADASLETGWGPYIKAGNTVGVMVTKGSDGTLRVSYFVDYKWLGTGFELVNTTATYYPCLHVSGKAKLVVEYPSDLPSTEPDTTTREGIEGTWDLEKVWDGENELDIPRRGGPFLLKLARESGGFLDIAFKFANRMGGKAKIVADAGNALTIECDGFISTRMMPPPEIRPLESLFSRSITAVTLQDATLVVSGQELKSFYSRHVRKPKTLGSY